ncbi:patatin-like phospholipase family protein [Eubacterium ruminantium]|uniref:patatin-like phospholipase family protein n=1 Tax=Eubacterium ruminantium TaxID=42322 RepID=UPI0023F088C3|nr:patatin family protein [Eubacterium ruminantium]
MMNDKRLGLVLEGGGMRGVYTAGVLDEFLENGIKVDGLVGVSAGILHGISYISEQYGRNIRYIIKYRSNPRFMSAKSYFKTGNICETEFCYHEIPEKLNKFDYDKFRENAKEVEVYAGCTNLENGKAEYVRIYDLATDDIDAVRASASLPLVSEIVEYRGLKLQDGGNADSIPLKFMMDKGFKKNIVVLTRPKGYVKKNSKTNGLMKAFYKEYPRYIETAENRAENYNASLKLCAEMEEAGDAFIIQPSRDLKVKRTEKKIEKLKRIYKLGRFDAQNKMEELKRFLENA